MVSPTAPDWLTLGRFVAIDVETASRSPMSVCAVGAVRFESGRETDAFRSLVQVKGPVRFGKIHGLEAADLAGAPAWPGVWRDLMQFVGDIQEFVAYRATFDRGAILAMCASHNVRVPPMRFTCAAEIVESRFARKLQLREALDLLGVSFPGRPHDPLADARAAAAAAIACASSLPASAGS
jgi:DNA polymerase-3 subunit epsilon